MSRCSAKLIHVCEKLPLHWIAGRANVLFKSLKYILFNFGRGFCDSFSMFFPEVPAFCGKNI